MTEQCAVMQEGNVSNPISEGQRSSADEIMACEDTAIAVLSSGLKRPVLRDVPDEDAPVSKKQCVDDVKSPTACTGGDKPATKTSPGKPKVGFHSKCKYNIWI